MRIEKSSNRSNVNRPNTLLTGAVVATAAAIASVALFNPTPATAQQQQSRPNILVIFGDDIGQTNISAYRRPRWLQNTEYRSDCP